MQKRSLYAAFLAAVVGVAGAILAISRRRTASIAEVAIQSPAISPPVIQETSIPAERSTAKELSKPSMLILIESGLGTACLITAQTLLLHSRNPILPLILFTIGIVALQPLLASQEYPQKMDFLEIQPQTRLMILALAVVALLLNIFAPPPFNSLPEQFQIVTALVSVLIVPAVYLVGAAYFSSQVGLIAAGFAAVSGWTLALGKAELQYISLSIISAMSLVALEYVRRRQGRVIYAIWLAFFIGIVAVVTRLWLPSMPIDSRAEQLLPNPQLSLSESLFTSLLMFNLTSDPNPLHGIVDRSVFSPVLSALFVVGLLSLAWRIDTRRRWIEIFLLVVLATTLLPSAFQLETPVRYPDLQRGAMALPVAVTIAALGASSLAEALMIRLRRTGFLIALVLFVAALLVIALDANQHYINVFLPIYERGVLVLPSGDISVISPK